MEYKIKIWDNRKLKNHVDKFGDPLVVAGNKYRFRDEKGFQGFSYFTPAFFHNRLQERFYPFGYDGVELSKMERQEKLGLSIHRYDRNVVALKGDELIGISSFMWVRGGQSYWHYFQSFIETREDSRNCGVAKALMNRLNQPCFLWNKIWRFSSGDFTADGDEFLKHVYERDLDTSKLAIINTFHNKGAPLGPGVFDARGNELNSFDEMPHSF